MFLNRKLSTSQIIILSFLSIILLGSILLMLPVSSVNHEFTPFIDALFTSTSAVCVTGLIVVDTATHWSLFGQCVIIGLIQIGGMGVITLLFSMFMLSGKKIGLVQSKTMQDAISAPEIGGIYRLTHYILRGTLLFEFMGFLLLSIPFVKDFGLAKGLWYGFFHSISAFCNAGFDLMGVRQQFSSLTFYPSQPIVNLVIMSLIVIGGLGFLTWEDVVKNRHHFHRYRLQSKIILVTTSLLILIPAVYFFLCEYASCDLKERFFYSLFQSVTTRTAGFNTADLTTMKDTGIFLMIILMLIGGSPGSTAGGVKTTTFAVLIITMLCVFRKEAVTHFKGRRIDSDTIRDAISIVLMYLMFFAIGGSIISYIEGIPLLTALFESASAIGTVGLTLGITPQLGLISRLILIFLMYFGRVGGLTLIFATVSTKVQTGNHYPKEKVTVG